MAHKFRLDAHKQEIQVFHRRVIFAAGFVALLVLVLAGWMINLQFFNHDYFSARSDGNRLHSQFIPPTRGLIYDRNGRLLADNRPIFNLTVVRETATDFDQSLELLRKIVNLTDDDIQQYQTRLSRRAVPHTSVPLKIKLSDDEIARVAVSQHKLPGIAVEAQLLRYYPYGEAMAHALGYVSEINREELQAMSEEQARNYRGTNQVGKTGIEKNYESYLHGTVGFETVEKNNRGRVTRVLGRTDPIPGKDIQLHLDLPLQLAAEQALGERRGAIVAIDPATGGVLAMVSKPDFDPNLFVTGISRDQLAAMNRSRYSPMFNRAINPRVPGSTIKPIVGLAGLYHGIVDQEFVINDPGFYRLPGRSRPYYDWTWWVDKSGHGPVDLERAIYQSCNTYFSHIAVELGIDTLHDYLLTWGFGSNAALDIPDANPGLVPSPAWKRETRGEPWYPGETPPEGFGNGMFQATTLQMASAAATIANHGVMKRPRMLKALNDGTDDDFADIIFGDEDVLQPLLPSPEDIAYVRKAMEHTVSKPYDREHRRHEGTAYPYVHGAEPLAYPMGGKSGTAQVVGVQVDARGNRIDPEEINQDHLNHAMFIAFDASPQSRIAVAVYVENGEGGSSVAGPLAREVLDAYLLPILENEKLDEEAMLLTSSH
ncbi:penicillin-binding protein 2 [Pseudohongiella spirulinae]|uniref:Penicillin-binding protein 2 n=1 Tax=Pseudohongiella spirulinae TaxID=1249552 RepID=A0A0S2KET6_9GAMM|nr:penicillin-binding protein 2 [Pseudohongiella spirulinae]ALO46810.1 Penicillin-binding protein 2 [Pseudohongiella spirulinae]